MQPILLVPASITIGSTSTAVVARHDGRETSAALMTTSRKKHEKPVQTLLDNRADAGHCPSRR